jgi:hypothetical protein
MIISCRPVPKTFLTSDLLRAYSRHSTVIEKRHRKCGTMLRRRDTCQILPRYVQRVGSLEAPWPPKKTPRNVGPDALPLASHILQQYGIVNSQGPVIMVLEHVI